MNPQGLIDKYTLQVQNLESQRCWFSSMAESLGVEEQRKRCAELAEKLASKIREVQQRIAVLATQSTHA